MKKTSTNQSKLRLVLYHCTDTVVVVCNNPLYYTATILVNVITLMRLESVHSAALQTLRRADVFIYRTADTAIYRSNTCNTDCTCNTD